MASVRSGLRSRRRHIVCRKPVRSGTISVPRPDVILLQAVAYELYFDAAASAIGIRLGIIAERIKMRQIFSDRGKRCLFIPPTLRKIGLADSGRADTVKNRGCNGLS